MIKGGGREGQPLFAAAGMSAAPARKAGDATIMCGRYVLTTPAEALRRLFDFVEHPNLAPRYNIAPTQEVPVVRQRREPQGERSIQMLRWGLVPSWARDLSGGAKMINARAETVAEKPAFRKALAKRRCLVPADGFYEWRPAEGGKQPYLIRRPDGAPFAFAGLWERWSAPATAAATAEKPFIDSFTIVTTDANARLQPLHDRMPVIIDAADYARWLDPDAEPAALLPLLRPAPDDFLEFFPVDRRVNAVRNDDAALLAPLEAGR
jgi:putative SOS response-associated peptidase YedK